MQGKRQRRDRSDRRGHGKEERQRPGKDRDKDARNRGYEERGPQRAMKERLRTERIARADALTDHRLRCALQGTGHHKGEIGNDVERAKRRDQRRAEWGQHCDDRDVGRDDRETEDAFRQPEPRAAQRKREIAVPPSGSS